MSDFHFDSNGKSLKLNLKIYLSDGYVVVEFLNLSEEEKKFQHLTKILDRSQDLLFFKNSSLKYEYLNISFAKLFGKKREEIYGKTDKELLPKELYNQCLNGDLSAIKKGSYIGIERFNNRSYQVLKEFVDGGVLGIAKDITEELKQKSLAEIDSLTGLYNRRKFLEMIDYIYGNEVDSYYLFLIDLDDLRDLNNIYGHIKGDKYLKKLGEILNRYSEGVFFRIGGDEFAGLVNGEESEVKKILKNIYSDLNDLNFKPALSISVGIKKIDITKNYLENYTDADRLLYEAKKSGKKCYVISF